MLDDLVIQLRTPRSADHQIQLLLLTMTMPSPTAIPRAIPEEAEAEMVRIEMLPSKARLDVVVTASLDLLQVDLRKPTHPEPPCLLGLF